LKLITYKVVVAAAPTHMPLDRFRMRTILWAGALPRVRNR